MPSRNRFLLAIIASGFLFLGAASWTQEPEDRDPVLQQETPSTFRDVLKSKVGQKCQELSRDGEWTLTFPARVVSPFDHWSEEVRRVEAERLETEQQLREVTAQLERVEEQQRETLAVKKDELLSKLSSLRGAERRYRGVLQQQSREAPNLLVRTLVGVGEDFVHLRYEDGRERYVPLERVSSVLIRAR